VAWGWNSSARGLRQAVACRTGSSGGTRSESRSFLD
jgi:hypothetical protein